MKVLGAVILATLTSVGMHAQAESGDVASTTSPPQSRWTQDSFANTTKNSKQAKVKAFVNSLLPEDPKKSAPPPTKPARRPRAPTATAGNARGGWRKAVAPLFEAEAGTVRPRD